jgi:hypothetical protein
MGGTQIIVDKVKYQLGTFRTPEGASRAYDCMVVQHYGERACLTFKVY